ncbi:UNVERIFIED_CONTAM: hypothetical protein RMT77_008008 [Armadillidium vulgare]
MSLNSRFSDKSSLILLMLVVTGFLYVCFLSLPHISYLYKMDERTEKCLSSYLHHLPHQLKFITNSGKMSNENPNTNNWKNMTKSFLSKETEMKKERVKPLMVLIVTFWRSGSTWLGEMLSRTPNSFYLFEPVQMLSTNIHFDIGYNISSTEAVDVIRQMFLCSIKKEFVNFSKIWPLVYANKYCSDKTCLNYKSISNHCLTADYRIIKTVRMRMEKVEELFTYPTFSNLKVIFLVRDPRGTANSFSHLKKDFKGRFWTLGVEEICPRILSNVNVFTQLSVKFPDRLFFVRYEDLALNPFEKSVEMWNFLHSSKKWKTQPPQQWLSFIQESIKTKKKSLNNIKDRLHVTKRSTQEWQSWRTNISEKLLTRVQEYCRPLIKTLGYKIFNSFEEARNISYDVLSMRNCTKIPCLPRNKSKIISKLR